MGLQEMGGWEDSHKESYRFKIEVQRFCLESIVSGQTIAKEKTQTLEIQEPAFYFFRVPGGTRTHDIQNHNLTL